MIFVIDAHLPKSLCSIFIRLGHEAVHTSDFPTGNATSDAWISDYAYEQGAVVISKDQDFFHAFHLLGKPPKLVMVKVGNMRLKEINQLFAAQAEALAILLQEHDLVELYTDCLLVME